MQIAGLRTLYKERVAGSTVGRLASGMWDDIPFCQGIFSLPENLRSPG